MIKLNYDALQPAEKAIVDCLALANTSKLPLREIKDRLRAELVACEKSLMAPLDEEEQNTLLESILRLTKSLVALDNYFYEETARR